MSSRSARAGVDCAGSSSAPVAAPRLDQLARHLDVTLEADVAIVDHVRLVGVESIRQHARRAGGSANDIVVPLERVEAHRVRRTSRRARIASDASTSMPADLRASACASPARRAPARTAVRRGSGRSPARCASTASRNNAPSGAVHGRRVVDAHRPAHHADAGERARVARHGGAARRARRAAMAGRARRAIRRNTRGPSVGGEAEDRDRTHGQVRVVERRFISRSTLRPRRTRQAAGFASGSVRRCPNRALIDDDDAGGVEAAFGEELRRVAVIDERVRQSELQERNDDAGGGERFGNRAAGAAARRRSPRSVTSASCSRASLQRRGRRRAA